MVAAVGEGSLIASTGGTTPVAPLAGADWLAELHQLANEREFMPRCRCLCAGQPHGLKAQRIDSALLVLPLQGTQTVRDAANTVVVKPGGRGVTTLPNERVAASLCNWVAALRTQRLSLACHALVGLVLQLHEQGFHALLEPRAERLGERIRALVADNPGHDWTARHLEPLLLMSEASIRRHLAVEGTSLRQVVVDARLTVALELLYTTRLPIKTVATRVGYASSSSFVRRFVERYGIEPTKIGNVD